MRILVQMANLAGWFSWPEKALPTHSSSFLSGRTRTKQRITGTARNSRWQSLGLSATRPDLTEYHRGSGDRVRSRDNEKRRGHRLGAPRVAFWHVMTIRRCPAIALHRAIAVSGKVQRG